MSPKHTYFDQNNVRIGCKPWNVRRGVCSLLYVICRPGLGKSKFMSGGGFRENTYSFEQEQKKKFVEALQIPE